MENMWLMIARVSNDDTQENIVSWFKDALRTLLNKKNITTVSFINERDDDLYINAIIECAITHSSIEFEVYNTNEEEEEMNYTNTTIKEYTDEYSPQEWKEFFVSTDDILCNISKEIELCINNIPTIYPPIECIYTCLEDVSPKQIKVVILGQDPYPNEGQAHGYAFSVKNGTNIPPSLKNIQKEVISEGYSVSPNNRNLRKWAKQGVLLLNTALTVIAKKPNSHKNIWDAFTYAILQYINKVTDRCVFILWGVNACNYKTLINKRHVIICGGHPSPLNTSVPFLGTKPFSKANDALKSWDMTPIDWSI